MTWIYISAFVFTHRCVPQFYCSRLLYNFWMYWIILSIYLWFCWFQSSTEVFPTGVFLHLGFALFTWFKDVNTDEFTMIFLSICKLKAFQHDGLKQSCERVVSSFLLFIILFFYARKSKVHRHKLDVKFVKVAHTRRCYLQQQRAELVHHGNLLLQFISCEVRLCGSAPTWCIRQYFQQRWHLADLGDDW